MKSIIVTGGAAGIGAAICARFAAGGFRVGVLDMSREGAEKTAALLPGAMALQADVTDRASVEAAFAAFGDTPDVLINNAGIATFGPLLDQEPAAFARVTQVNLIGTYTCAWIAAKGMVARGSGIIINMTSINAVTPGPGSGAYPATKAGVGKLTEQMAIEWGEHGLRVNCIAPGFIDGGMSAPFYADAKVRALRGGAVPTGRLGTVEDIAEAAWFLASDNASYISGHQLVVDGAVCHSLLRALPRE
ncbi:MAG: SDR family NAD(P)-dependent oxidoreductase [Gemmobacter sp.]|nr:SDR family NAD(P)-dependent oxidoreductase [Gemmobacter sp.]